jgi:branched-subunit amino acid ABC-type transport system permease component
VSVGLVIQVVIAGLAAGAVYGLVAIGFSLVWRMTAVLQIAYGDLVGGSMFLVLVTAAGTGPVTATSVSTARYLLAAVLVIVVTAAAGAGFYYGIVRPFVQRGSALGWIGAIVAVALVVEGALAAAFPREAYVLPDPLPFSRWAPLSLPAGASLPVRTLWVLGVGLALAAMAGWLLTRTRFGAAVEAVASEPFGAQIIGLPVDRLTAIAFAVAGVMAGLAGIVGPPAGGSITVQTGLLLGLKAIAAAFLGGLSSPGRVYRAALLLGVFEAVVVNLHVPGFPWLSLGPAWGDVAPLALALLFIVFRAAPTMREPVE